MSTTQDIPLGYCQCGCGQKTPLATYTSARRQLIKGRPVRYLKSHWFRKPEQYVVEDRGYDTPCWVWQLATHAEDGHGRLDVCGRLRMAHVVYYERKFGPVAKGTHVHHKCEQPDCVNPDHLEPMTPAQHRQRHARHTWEQIREIRRRHAAGERQADLAREFGMSPAYMCNVIKGEKTWRETA